LGEKPRLRVYENRVLRRTFRPKRDEVTGEWKTLNSEELNDLHSSPNIILVTKSRRMRWVWHVARTGKGELHRGFLVWKPEGKRPIGRFRFRWENNIKIDIREVGWRHELDRAGSEYGQVTGICKCGNESLCSIKCGELLD
jgi:hypothetical protein